MVTDLGTDETWLISVIIQEPVFQCDMAVSLEKCIEFNMVISGGLVYDVVMKQTDPPFNIHLLDNQVSIIYNGD